MCVCVAGLHQILTDVIEEVRQSISLDIDGGQVVHSLLNASWLQSLLRVFSFFLATSSSFAASPGSSGSGRSCVPSCSPGLGCGSDTDLLTLRPCLFQVFECLQRFARDAPAPVLTNATGLLFQVMLACGCGLVLCFRWIFMSASALWWLQLLIDVRASEGSSEDTKELCHLLRQPHLQVRRTVAFQGFQKNGDDIC